MEAPKPSCEGSCYVVKHKASKKKSEWKKGFARIYGGSLYFYSQEKKPKAKFGIEIKDHLLVQETFEKKMALVIRAKGGSSDSFLVALSPVDSSASILTEWNTAFTNALKKDPIQMPIKDNTGLMNKAKQNIAGKAASSALGKSVMKSIIPEDIKQLLRSVRNVVVSVNGDTAAARETADKLERNTIKTVVKCYFLYENKAITLNDFQKVEPPLKQALKLLLAVYDHVEKIKDAEMKKMVLDEKFTIVSVLLQTVRDNLVSLLQTHVKPKSIERIHETIDKIAYTDFFLKAWGDPNLKSDVTYSMNFVRNYVKKL